MGALGLQELRFAAGPDGSIWIGTSGGLARFTPQQAALRTYAPDVVYTKVILGGKEVSPTSQPSVDHASNMLHIRFSALSFARESSVLFRYRLTPLFAEWHETQEHELQFDGLPPGKYRLQVLARDGWGRWSAEQATFSFQIRAPWWRPWVLPSLLGVPLLLVVLWSRARGAAMRRRQGILVQLVENRTAELKEANAHLLRLSRIEHDKELADEQGAHAEEVALMNRRAIEALALAIEAKDQTTSDHLHRVEIYAVGVAQELGLSETQLEALRAAALLHDVGKLAVPEYIISKPGRLTQEEFEKMKIHTVVGAEIVERIGFPYPVAPMVRSHHEKWNGLGYPDGLCGEEIPIGARILAAVDCLDALASDRQYRRALPLEEAMKVVQAEAGVSYDPAVVEVLARRIGDLESMVRSSATIPKKKLSSDLIIACGESPAAGFQATAPSLPLNCSLINLHNSTVGEDPEDKNLALLARRIGDCRQPGEIFAALRQSLRGLVPYDAMVVYLCLDDRLIPESLDGEDYRLFASLEIPIGMGLSGWVAENRKPIINGNPSVEPGYLNDPTRFSVLRSALAVPLESEERVVGVLSLYRIERDAFSALDLARLLSLGETLARALVLTAQLTAAALDSAPQAI